MSVIKIKSHIRDYDVRFKKASGFLNEIDNGSVHNCYIIDENVWELYHGNTFSDRDTNRVIVLPISEERKNLHTVQELYDCLIERSAKRNMMLVSIGGGIVQDITGFLASTLYRGIQWIFIPTTLLAQADSCIGSKTSLNYKSYKNLIGTFYPPIGVCIDTAFLNTLKDIDFYSGLGEAVKLHIMGGERHVNSILELFPEIISRKQEALEATVYQSLLIKQGYIEGDEFDTGRRNLLNYGHCFGHALETTSGFEIPHGQAVVIGMILANIVSRRRNLLSRTLEYFLLQRALVPSLVEKPRKCFLKSETIISAMKKDKKRTGEGLPLITMAEGYAMIKIDDLGEQEAEHAIDEMISMLEISD
jgi:3-dehydroquinate synthase